jgi:hypothetical protein
MASVLCIPVKSNRMNINHESLRMLKEAVMPYSKIGLAVVWKN